MKRQSGRSKRVRTRTDAQIAEFERRDLGDDIRRSGAVRLLRVRPKPTSILLDRALVNELRKKAAKRGLGYQTMLKMIVREHLHEY
jgi:predicted DNA binding CopG/RHH family protein